MSRLEEISVAYRKALITKNRYNINSEYTSGHPDALSTGDENGKGENNGQAGGLTDIKTRNTLLTKNKYNNNKQYDAGTV